MSIIISYESNDVAQSLCEGWLSYLKVLLAICKFLHAYTVMVLYSRQIQLSVIIQPTFNIL
jgi:hypothetical protein